MINFETENPKGRVDVLAYNGLKYLAGLAEQKTGLAGLWDSVQPHVNKLVNDHVTPMETPSELKVLLHILQANYQHPTIEEK